MEGDLTAHAIVYDSDLILLKPMMDSDLTALMPWEQLQAVVDVFLLRNHRLHGGGVNLRHRGRRLGVCPLHLTSALKFHPDLCNSVVFVCS